MVISLTMRAGTNQHTLFKLPKMFVTGIKIAKKLKCGVLKIHAPQTFRRMVMFTLFFVMNSVNSVNRVKFIT